MKEKIIKNIRQHETLRNDLIYSMLLFSLALLITTVTCKGKTPLGNPNAVLGELTANMPISQQLPVSGETISQIDLIFGTYNRTNNSNLQLLLLDEEGTVYAKKMLSCSELLDNSAYSWIFKPVFFAEGAQAILEILPYGKVGNTITLYYDDSMAGEIMVGDYVYSGQLAGVIYGGTRFQSVFSFGISPIRAFMLLTFVWLCTFFIYQKKELILVAQCLFVTAPCILVIFFAMPPIITFDTAHYLNYLPILNGSIGFENWDIVRGPVFPSILSFAVGFFGKNCSGLLTMQFLFFEITLFFLLVSMQCISSKFKWKLEFVVAVVMIFVFNPIFFGGYHATLTEFPAALFAVLSCLISWKFAKRDGPLNRIDLFYVIYFALFSVTCWQLKQPYLGCVVYPAFAVVLYTGIVRIKQNKPRVVLRAVTPFLCIRL